MRMEPARKRQLLLEAVPATSRWAPGRRLCHSVRSHRTIYEDPVNYVRLEEDDAVLREWPPGHHAHPKVFTVDQMTRLLKGMTVKDHRIWLQKLFQGEAPLVPAFKDEEVALLAPQ